MREKTLRAADEWERYSEKLAEKRQVAFILSPDDSLGNDGYAIASDDALTTVASSSARGLLYGAYALIDACRQAGNYFVAMNVREKPDFAMRMLLFETRDYRYRLMREMLEKNVKDASFVEIFKNHCKK